jgi:hypothetical protein
MRTRKMRSALLTASALIVTAVFACAQGTDPNATGDTTGGDGTDTDGGTGLPPTNNFDGGSNPYQTPTDGGVSHPKNDSGSGTSTNEGGTTMSMDSGTTMQKDSGTTMTGNGDCVGTDSMSIAGETYDDECDAYWSNNLTIFTGKSKSNNCTPGANTCAALNGTGGYTFCCYVPAPTDFCADDYNNKPQCVPQ